MAKSPPVFAHMWWDSGWGIVWALVMAGFWIAVIAERPAGAWTARSCANPVGICGRDSLH